ncbi:hypothetical protein HYE67_010324 [Fusarium culmorum]|uniref:Uncharacterized protein n=1 Tax=Fusarium culmorum TaxID=5516 RepID=A0A7S8I0K0_FUSCU|nr:hypothetical protein HYE67_010324 [Fusarium culmorum]
MVSKVRVQLYNASLVPEDHASNSNRTVLLLLHKRLEGPLTIQPTCSTCHLEALAATREGRHQNVQSRIALAQRASMSRLPELDAVLVFGGCFSQAELVEVAIACTIVDSSCRIKRYSRSSL